MALKRLVGSELLLGGGETATPVEQVLPPEASAYVLGVLVVCAQKADDLVAALIELAADRKEEERPRLQVIVVSVEEDEQPFMDSVRDLPWPALPRTAAHKKMLLLRRLRVKGVAPALALVEMPSGRLITSAGRERLLQQPDKFPWHARPLREALKDVDLGKQLDKPQSYSDLNGVKAFYFSANWCPPCKAFTPQLVETYNRVREKGHRFDVIFVSSDRSESSFEQYKCGMPWLVIPFECDELRKELATSLDVQGIPSLVLVDADDRIITNEGRQEICDDPKGKYFPWPERRIFPLTDRTLLRMHDRPAVILLVESEEELLFAESALLPAAQKYWKSAKEKCGESPSLEEEENELQFFIGYDSDTSDTVREFAGLEDWVPLLVVLEVFNQRVATQAEGVEVTAEATSHFVSQYLACKLQWTELATELQQQTPTVIES